MSKSLHESLRAALDPSLAKKEKPEPKADVTWPELETPDVSEGEELFSKVWGWVPEDGDFPVRVYSDQPDVPEKISYIWPKKETEIFVRSLSMGLKPRLIGDAGTGKTEMAKQVAAMLGRPYYAFNFNSALELAQVVGEVRFIGGETRFIRGALPKAMGLPAIVLFDELTRATSEMTMGLQRFNDTGELVLMDDIENDSPVLTCHPDFRLVAADNTRGLGDSMDRYNAAQVQDTSTLNRWDLVIPVDYQSREVEVKYLLQVEPNLPKSVATDIAKFSELAHNGFKSGELSLPFSMRNLRKVAQLSMVLRSAQKAIEWNYLNALDEDSLSTARQLMRTVFGS